jgi:tight adherence protein B
MTLSQVAVFAVVFSVMMGVMSLVPGLFEIYRERSQTSLRRTSRELDKFFLNIKPITIILIMVGFGVVLGITSGNWVLALGVAAAGAFSPKIILAVWKDIRSAKFETQLMDALLLISNSLKSGLDIAAGIEKVANEMKPPISEEFNLVLNAYKLGTPLEAALLELTNRINSRTLETVVYAITIQRETGGNIIKIFEQLVMTIREETKLQKKMKALTSQARTQIIFLACFPWVLGLIFLFAAPEFMQPALKNPWGQAALVFLVFWEMIGVIVTKKIATVSV